MVEAFVSTQGTGFADLLTPEQQADLNRRLAHPFEPADPERIKAIFARHGIQADL